MSRVWPYDVKVNEPFIPIDPLRPFKCLLLMPFKPQFAVVAELLKSWVDELAEELLAPYGLQLPQIKRLDWINSSGAIQDQLWHELLEADLVFCDITDYNHNVLFEAGVAAGWKPIHKVAFILSSTSSAPHPFDLFPLRYFKYDLTDAGIPAFRESIRAVTRDAIIPFPDEQIVASAITLPAEFDFATGLDDLRLYTPPYCHRRVVSGALQFGSLFLYSHSWASVGNTRLLNVHLHFEARFGARLTEGPDSKIGAALRSQNYYANFAHVLVLGADGSIILTEPEATAPGAYRNITLRGATPIDPSAIHDFEMTFTETNLQIRIDEFEATFPTSDMHAVLGPGIVRFHGTRAFMEITKATINAA